MFWSNFWDIIGWFFWVFAFTAYLFALFAVIGDLFRDRELNGWLKALWLIFLIFVPFLTVIVYLIARGNGMALRGMRQAEEAQQATDKYIRNVASASPSEEIAKAKGLLDTGAISRQEYDDIKARALG
jgi:voltage-gated potassium channel Kch